MPSEFSELFAALPTELSNLVQAELAAGNSIIEIGHSHPAPPVGAYVKLAKKISTRPRASGGGLSFYERNSSLYSGEFTDAKRFYFVLEPPLPPPPEPDMDAIRAAIEARQRAADAERCPDRTVIDYRSGLAERAAVPPRPTAAATSASSAVERFRESMAMNYERWHDGIGYDLEILKTATPEELVSIEEILLSHGTEDWRDVEALAELDSPRARVALRKAVKSSKHEVRLALLRHAPALVSDDERIAALVAAIRGATNYGGLTEALLEIESFHPPEIMTALLRGLMERDGGTACHIAAMLYFLHGKAASAFDWNHRPFFLRFNTPDLVERETVVRELCKTIGVDPHRCIKPKP